MSKGLTEREQMLVDIEYYKHCHDNTEFLLPDEALCLLDAYANESMRRYGKVNKKARLYLKLLRIAKPYEVTAKDGTKYRNIGDYIDSGT